MRFSKVTSFIYIYSFCTNLLSPVADRLRARARESRVVFLQKKKKKKAPHFSPRLAQRTKDRETFVDVSHALGPFSRATQRNGRGKEIPRALPLPTALSSPPVFVPDDDQSRPGLICGVSPLLAATIESQSRDVHSDTLREYVRRFHEQRERGAKAKRRKEVKRERERERGPYSRAFLEYSHIAATRTCSRN